MRRLPDLPDKYLRLFDDFDLSECALEVTDADLEMWAALGTKADDLKDVSERVRYLLYLAK